MARNGVIKEFTGISSPFQNPENAELVLDGAETIETNVDIVIQYLTNNGFI